jgi:hypothetical protein
MLLLLQFWTKLLLLQLGQNLVQVVACSSSRKVLGLTPTAVFALATPKSPIDRGTQYLTCAQYLTILEACHLVIVFSCAVFTVRMKQLSLGSMVVILRANVPSLTAYESPQFRCQSECTIPTICFVIGCLDHYCLLGGSWAAPIRNRLHLYVFYCTIVRHFHFFRRHFWQPMSKNGLGGRKFGRLSTWLAKSSTCLLGPEH